MHVYSTLIGGLIAGSTSAKLCKNMKKRPCKKDNLCKWAKGTGTCAFKDEKKLRKTRIIAEGAASVTPENCVSQADVEAAVDAAVAAAKIVAHAEGVASVMESPTESSTQPPTESPSESSTEDECEFGCYECNEPPKECYYYYVMGDGFGYSCPYDCQVAWGEGGGEGPGGPCGECTAWWCKCDDDFNRRKGCPECEGEGEACYQDDKDPYRRGFKCKCEEVEEEEEEEEAGYENGCCYYKDGECAYYDTEFC